MAIASIVFDPLDGSEALSAAAVADSKALSAGALASEAESEAVVADSKGVSAGVVGSTADSKAVVADSKAVSAGTLASTAKAEADSAIGSEPGVGEYKITDMKRNAAGSIVVEYDDSAIT